MYISSELRHEIYFPKLILVEEFIRIVHNEEVKDLRNKVHISVIHINIK